MTEEIFYHASHKLALTNHFLENDWVWLYKKVWTQINNEDIYSVYFSYLATPTTAAKALRSCNIDIPIDNPVALMSDYSYRSHYYPGFEHLVIVRDFYNIKPAIHDVRIADEIIFYHNLVEVQNNGVKQYYSVSRNSKELVCEVTADSVRILNRFLTEYMAAKCMDLVSICQSEVEFYIDKVAIPFEIHYTPKFEFKDISPNPHSHFEICVACNAGPVQSWFNGKTVFPHLSIKTIMEQMKPEINFIIGTDENGLPIYSSKDTHPYTPIYFKKDVRTLYCNNQDCVIGPLNITTSSFSLRCDNDNDNYIIAFLKDIKDIPYNEQYVWRGYNIPPDGKKFSDIFQHSILEGNWNGVVKSIDFIFRDTYKSLLNKWTRKYSWEIFKPLNGVQSDAPSKICSLVSDDYPSLKILVENLVLSLHESFNISAFSDISPKIDLIREVEVNGEKVKKVHSEPDIDYFQRICAILNIESSIIFEYFKMLQSLRSYMLHRNPSKDKPNFKKVLLYFGMNEDKSNSKEVSYNILSKGVDAMNSIIAQL